MNVAVPSALHNASSSCPFGFDIVLIRMRMSVLKSRLRESSCVNSSLLAMSGKQSDHIRPAAFSSFSLCQTCSYVRPMKVSICSNTDTQTCMTSFCR